MLVGLNGRWKAPIGYFFTNHISAEQHANLIKSSFCRVANSGVDVRAVVADGLSANVRSAILLGCNLSLDELQTFFPHPLYPERVIYFVFDAAHMLKLMRNLIAERKILLYKTENNDFETIEWRYIVELHKIQSEESLYLANKISGRHINYQNVKMKVSLAAQTLSASVATAIEFLRDEMHLPQFAGSEGTVRFIRIIDRLFDLLNSKNPLAKGYKAPLSISNRQFWEPCLNKACNYLKNLYEQKTMKPLVDGRKSQGPLGLIITATSVLNLSYDLLLTQEMKYLLTFKLSQDHLEVFFSLIRRRGGWNNNPNTEQFRASLRALIIKNNIPYSRNSNSINLDGTETLQLEPCSRCPVDLKSRSDDSFVNDPDFLLAVRNLERSEELSDPDWRMNCLVYTAEYVVRHLKIDCKKCHNALLADSRTYPDRESLKFLRCRNNGGLIIPSKGVVEVIKATEKAFRFIMPSPKLMETLPPTRFLDIRIQTAVLSHFQSKIEYIFPQLCDHALDFDISLFDDHVTHLIREITKYFLRISKAAHSCQIAPPENRFKGNVFKKDEM